MRTEHDLTKTENYWSSYLREGVIERSAGWEPRSSSYTTRKSTLSSNDNLHDKTDKLLDDRIKEAKSTESPIRPMNETVIPSYTHEEFRSITR